MSAVPTGAKLLAFLLKAFAMVAIAAAFLVLVFAIVGGASTLSTVIAVGSIVSGSITFFWLGYVIELLGLIVEKRS